MGVDKLLPIVVFRRHQRCCQKPFVYSLPQIHVSARPAPFAEDAHAIIPNANTSRNEQVAIGIVTFFS